MIKSPLTTLRAAFRNVEAAHDNVSGIDLISDPAHRFMSGIHVIHHNAAHEVVSGLSIKGSPLSELRAVFDREAPLSDA